MLQLYLRPVQCRVLICCIPCTDPLYLQPFLPPSSPAQTLSLSLGVLCHPVLHLLLTDRLSHMQTLQTCSFSKGSLEGSSRESLNKSSNQLRFSSLLSTSWPVCCSVFFWLTQIFSSFSACKFLLLHIELLLCLLCFCLPRLFISMD